MKLTRNHINPSATIDTEVHVFEIMNDELDYSIWPNVYNYVGGIVWARLWVNLYAQVHRNVIFIHS